MEKLQRCAVSIGVRIGTIIGVFTDDIALWISLGLALGAAYKYKLIKQENEPN